MRLPALAAALDYTIVDAAQALLARRSRMELARQARRLRALAVPLGLGDVQQARNGSHREEEVV
jgi:hypothetical protein